MEEKDKNNDEISPSKQARVDSFQSELLCILLF